MVNWLEKSVFSAIIREFVFSESLDLSWLVLTVGVLEVIRIFLYKLIIYWLVLTVEVLEEVRTIHLDRQVF